MLDLNKIKCHLLKTKKKEAIVLKLELSHLRIKISNLDSYSVFPLCFYAIQRNTL